MPGTKPKIYSNTDNYRAVPINNVMILWCFLKDISQGNMIKQVINDVYVNALIPVYLVHPGFALRYKKPL